MSQVSAFKTTHCFYGCGHRETELTHVESSDAMERHYWDAHYDQDTRDKLRTEGQPTERIRDKA